MTDEVSLPLAGMPVVEPNGQLNEVWYRFFLVLLQRTGGSSGDDTEVLQRIDLLLRRYVATDAAFEAVAVPPPRIGANVAPEVVPYRRQDPAAPLERVASHGQHFDGGLHAVVTATDNGFMLAADKAKLDGITAYGDPNDWSQVAKASLPTPATANKGWRRYVTDATGATGIIPAYCNGSAWKRFSDDSTVN